ncbi:MAG: Ig-like domain-containing protein [Gammaproteobacteria bacterium]|nr:Ig-like domain-containing protein [Gammaproteobacteria bacterium]
MILQKKLQLLLSFFIISLITACGGGSPKDTAVKPEPTNVAPIANPDSATTNRSTMVTIDVLKNDIDDNTLTIDSLGVIANGTAVIKGNKVEYTPNMQFAGSESFSYRIIDSHGVTALATITITVNNNITITGRVIDLAKDQQKIIIKVGETEYSSLSDKDGQFSVLIIIDNSTDLVTIFAENVSSNYSLKRQLGSVEYILKNKDQQYHFNNANLSNISTAEYELLNWVNNDKAITSAQELAKNRLKINTNNVVKLAITAKLIQKHTELELPNTYTSINSLYNNPFIADKLLSKWRIEHTQKYYEAYNSLFSNTKQTIMPTELLNKSSILKIPNLINYPLLSHIMHIDEDNSGSYFTSNNVGQTLTWDQGDNALELTFTNPIITSYTESYCGGLASAGATFNTEKLSLTQIYSTASYQVYLTKAQGRFNSDNECFSAQNHSSDFNTLTLQSPNDLEITAGRYYFEGAKLSTDPSKAVESYDYVSATFDLTNNGEFTETIDSKTSPTHGTWDVVNGSLELTYSDSVRVVYQKYGQHNDLDLASFYVINDGKIAIASDTLIVKQQDFTLDFSSGSLYWAQLPLFNPDINGNFGLALNANGTGYQVKQINKQWYHPDQYQYVWHLKQGIFFLSYLADFCDGDNNCQKLEWSHRELEVIGKTNDYYIVKSYTQYTDGRYYKRGYINLFRHSNQ